MKRMLAVALWSAVGCLVAAPAFGQDAPRREPPPERGPRPAVAVKEALAKVKLTDDQKKQIDPILEKFAKDMQANFEKNRDAAQKLEGEIRQARENKDEAKVKELMGELQKLRPNMEAAFKDLRAQIDPILTDSQKEQFGQALREAFRPAGPPPMRPGAIIERILQNAEKLGLAAEQKTKIEGLWKDAREAMQKAGEGADGEKARRELGEKLMKDVKEVLGDKWEKARELMGPPPGPREGGMGILNERIAKELNLTEEQKKTLADLRQKAEEAVKQAKTDQEKTDIRKKLRDDIQAQLTAEQKEKLEKLMKEMRERRPGGDQPPPPPPSAPAPAPGPL